MKRSRASAGGLFVLLLLLPQAQADDPAQAARDQAVVETLLRLPDYDLNQNPQLRDAVHRHLKTLEGTAQYLDLVDKLNVRDVTDQLLRLVLERPNETQGVRAAELLLRFEERDKLHQALQGPDEQQAAVATAVGHAGGDEALQLLSPLVADLDRSLAVRSAAARGLGRNLQGQQTLLQMVVDGQLPDALHFTVADVLFASSDPQIRDEAAQHLSLPAAKDAQPLPPVAELAGRRGDAERGRQLFFSTATCGNCHQVYGEGKEVGPDLSEIGSKLSREAMYVSILDPNAGISHSYETYAVILESGNVVVGILVSDSDQSLTIKTAEAIEHTFAQDEIEQIVKQDISLMPTNLQQLVSEQELVDVVEFLTTLTGEGS